ncbi:MAG: hypothetical protein FJ403_04230 [Verrucomicrobia bacterium]|nr:hypothetical protein [Verrucomicrobiota bacterium]
MFKEILHNIVKHSRAMRVAIRIQTDAGKFHLTVSDNGCGFQTSGTSFGHGVKSLRRRAADLGGEIAITSQPGQGTAIIIAVPLARPRRCWWNLAGDSSQ